MSSAAALRARIESALGEHLSSTLLLRERPAPLTVPFGVAALDALTGGLPRGALSEIAGPASSGRTGVMLAALAGATRRQEVCALVDAGDSLDPVSAAATGVDLERLLWVRCSDRTHVSHGKGDAPRAALGRLKSGSPTPRCGAGFAFGGVLEQVLKVTDLLLQSGGFGMVVLDLGDIPPESAWRVPLTSWFRFRRAVEPTATVLLLIEQEPCARTCASLVLRLEREAVCARDSGHVFTKELLMGLWQPTHSHEKFSTGLCHPERGFGRLRPNPSRRTPILPPSSNSPCSSREMAPSGLQVTEGLSRGIPARVPYPFREAKGWESSRDGEGSFLGIPENNVVSHAALLRGIRLRAETQRKAAQPAIAHFELCARAGL